MTEEAGTREALIQGYPWLKSGREPALDERTQRFVFKAFDRTLGKFLPHDVQAPILDVGCGEGALLAYFSARGYSNLAGFDLSPANVELCHSRGLGFVQELDALALGGFEQGTQWSLITCFDLIEHLPKQRAVEFVATIRRRTAPGGTAVVQTPNMGSVLASFHRYHDLTHEWGTTEDGALDLFVAAGYAPEHVKVGPAWNATSLRGRLRELYVRGLHAAIYLSENRPRPRIPTKNLLISATKE